MGELKEQDEAIKFLASPFLEIITTADFFRKHNCGNKLHICSIINAKSGLCDGDCKYCAQSRISKAKIKTYPMISAEEILSQAKKLKELGAQRISIVTSGKALSEKEFKTVLRAIELLKIYLPEVQICASLGMISLERMKTLKQAGLSRYHHNIETSERYYRQIVSSHSFKDRIRTIEFAKQIGLQVCCGGIIGMGESWQDRIEMAITLKKLDVDSVPLNILIPIAGTPLEKVPPMDPLDVLKTISLFRYILKDKEIRLVAGREKLLGQMQILAFLSGANGIMVGGYLTVKGAPKQEDKKLIEDIIEEWHRVSQLKVLEIPKI